MKPLLSLAIAFAGMISGCAGDAEPHPDPEQIQLLLEAIETQAPGGSSSGAAKAEASLLRADRIVDTVAKAQPDKMDPDIAASLFAG